MEVKTKKKKPMNGVVEMDSDGDGDGDDDAPAAANGRTVPAASTSSAASSAADVYDMKKREPLYAHAEVRHARKNTALS